MAEKLTHWRATQDPNYLGAWALQPGEEPILTITAAGMEKVIGSDGKKEDCLVIRYKGVGPGKMIVNATNSRSIEKLAGTPYIEKWTGTQIQVYAEKVRAFGDVVDAIRIRPFKPKTAEGLAQYTTERFGAPKCSACAQKRAAAENGAANV